MFELIYTSVPQGLLPGTRGFSTAAFTAGMPPNLIMPLENLSGYNFTFQDGTLPDELNPPCCRYIKMRFGNQLLRVASRIAPNGLDYSKRNNKIAHHWLFESADEITQSGTGAAGLLGSKACFVRDFQGTPRELAFRRVPIAAPGTLPAKTFQQLAGDSGWAGWIVHQYRTAPDVPLYVKYPRHTDSAQLLDMVNELCALLTPDEIADFTFSTYFAPAGNSVECFLRMLPDFSPLLTNIERFHTDKLLVLDGWQTLPPEYNDLPVCGTARSGNSPEQEAITLPDDPEDESDHYALPLPPRNIPPAQPKISITVQQLPRSENSSATKHSNSAVPKKLRAAALVTIAAIMVISLLVLLYPQKKVEAQATPPAPASIKVAASEKAVFPAPAEKSAQTAISIKTEKQVQKPISIKTEKSIKVKKNVPAFRPGTEFMLRNASTRDRALPVDGGTGLEFFIELNKAANHSGTDYTMPLPEKLQFPDEIYVTLRIPGQDRILPDSDSFIRKNPQGGITVTDAEPGVLPYRPRPANSNGPELHIVQSSDGRSLIFTRTGNYRQSTVPAVKNIDKIYFRFKNNVRVAERKFRKEYLQFIQPGKLALEINGVFTYQPSPLEIALSHIIVPQIGQTSMLTFCSQSLPIIQWNQKVQLYNQMQAESDKKKKAVNALLLPGAKPSTADELKKIAVSVKKTASFNDVDKTIRQITDTLEGFFSTELLRRNTASDEDIKDFAKDILEKLEDCSEDKKSQRVKVDDARKLWIEKRRRIANLRKLLTDYQQHAKNLKMLKQDIDSLYNRMLNPVRPAGDAVVNKFAFMLSDSTTGQPRIFTDQEIARLTVLIQQQIKIVPIQAD